MTIDLFFALYSEENRSKLRYAGLWFCRFALLCLTEKKLNRRITWLTKIKQLTLEHTDRSGRVHRFRCQWLSSLRQLLWQ